MTLDNRSLESQVVHFLLGIFKLVFNFSSSKALSLSITVSAFGPFFRRQDPALLSAADSLTCVVAHVILRSPETYVVKEKLVKNGAWEAGDRRSYVRWRM